MSNIDMNAPDYIPAKNDCKKSLLMLINVRGMQKTAVKK